MNNIACGAGHCLPGSLPALQKPIQYSEEEMRAVMEPAHEAEAGPGPGSTRAGAAAAAATAAPGPVQAEAPAHGVPAARPSDPKAALKALMDSIPTSREEVGTA